MEELIKKKTVLDICDRWRRQTSDAHDKNGFYIVDTIYTQIQEIAEAGPQGKWINKGYYAICSNCGTNSGTQFDGIEPIPLKTNFCSNCGAKMKGVDDE